MSPMRPSHKTLGAACLTACLLTAARPALAEGFSVLLGDRRPLGPRITELDASLGRVGDGVGLIIQARVEPDDALPAIRPTHKDLRLSLNERRLKRAAYWYDEATGALRLALTREVLKTLCGPLPEPFRSFPQNRDFAGCRFELAVQSPAGGSATKELRFPDPEAALSTLLGPDAPPSLRLAPLIPGRLGAPGASRPRLGMRRLKGPRPLPGADHARLALLPAANGHIAAVMAGNGQPAWLNLGPAASSPRLAHPKPEPESAALVGAAHNVQDYGLFHDPRRHGQPGTLTIQNMATGRRLALPRELYDIDDFWPSEEQVVVIDGSHLSAYGWDGRQRWQRTLLKGDRPLGTVLGGGVLIDDAQGGIYLLGIGHAPVGDLRVPFLYGATFAQDGTPRASSLLLAPAFGEFDAIEEVQPAVLAGRYLAAVSLSSAAGTRVRTRLFDMAEPSGKPLVELTPPTSTAPWWVWGTVTVGERLFVGTGNSGIAVYTAEEVR
jgi:hypothetical protein